MYRTLSVAQYREGLRAGLGGPGGRAAVGRHNGRIAGVDVGDKRSWVCVIDAVEGGELELTRIVSNGAGLRRYFARRPHMRVVLEAGTHSPWMSRGLEALGHEVVVANARHVRLVYAGRQKGRRETGEVGALR